MRKTRAVAPAALAAAVFALAACTSSGSSAPPSSTPSSSTPSSSTITSTVTRTATAVRTASAPAASTTASHTHGSSDQCTSSQLAISRGPFDGAGGHDGYPLLFRNVSDHTCTLHGYPGLDAIRPGHPPVHANRSLRGYLGGSEHGVPTVRLAPGQSASALFEYTHNDARHTTGNCPMTGTIAVTAANTTRTVTLHAMTSICYLYVHPTVPGSIGQDR